MSTHNIGFYEDQAILMSTHNIGFYEDLNKIIFQLSSPYTHLISSSAYRRRQVLMLLTKANYPM